jgi:hypothetical protein
MTRFGMNEADFGPVADFIARALKNEDVKEEVAVYRSKFVTMRYTLPLEESLGLAACALATAFPTNEYAKRFVENLQSFGDSNRNSR